MRKIEGERIIIMPETEIRIFEGVAEDTILSNAYKILQPRIS